MFCGLGRPAFAGQFRWFYRRLFPRRGALRHGFSQLSAIAFARLRRTRCASGLHLPSAVDIRWAPALTQDSDSSFLIRAKLPACVGALDRHRRVRRATDRELRPLHCALNCKAPDLTRWTFSGKFEGRTR